MDIKFPGGEVTEVTVDSGAEESVRPCNWRELHLANASGAVIPHYGQRVVEVEAFFYGPDSVNLCP